MSVWYCEKTDRNNIAVSSRIRLARNINGIPFPSSMTPSQLSDVNERVRKVITESNTPFAGTLKYIPMDNITEIERYSMVERHIISREFAENFEGRAIILSEDESICIMLGEEDHIRIQIIRPGMDLDHAYDIADRLDNLLCSKLDIAFDDNLGFLTECPTNLGTGLRASVMLHLPLLEATSAIKTLAESIGKIGFTVRGMYGEGSKAAASLYQISNQITLGISEKSAIDNLGIITRQLVDKEIEARKGLDDLKAEDISMRALGILKNARILSSGEMMKLISEMQLGISLGKIDNTDIMPIKMLIEGQPYMLMRKYGNLTADERDIYRAEMIRGLLSK